MSTPIALDRDLPLRPDLAAVAAEVLQGVQYSFVAAAAHPEIRLPFGSLEEAFQGAIGLRPAERRWVYHMRARRIAMAPAAVRQATFGWYGRFGVEEFACGGLAIAQRYLSAERGAHRARMGRRSLADAPRLHPKATDRAAASPPSAAGFSHPARGTLALYITEVSCLDRTSEAPKGETVALGGLAVDPSGALAKVGGFLVRDDFEHGVRKEYGYPGRKFCEFPVPEALGDEPVTYGAAAFLEVADRAGFCESLAGAWAKASPILRDALETRSAGARPDAISRAACWIVERFVRWLGTEFQEDMFPPSFAFAGVDKGTGVGGEASRKEVTGAIGQLTFAGRGGRYRVGGQWRMGSAHSPQ